VSDPGAAAEGGDATRSAYEELRLRVVTGAGCGNPFGLVLVAREGVAGWMARRAAGSPPKVTEAAPSRCAPLLGVTDEMHAGIVRVLADMALSRAKEMNA